ncbi:MAG: arginase family protein [Pseudomonadota bacterium]
MTISLIYAYWPNQPFGVTWCDLPWAVRSAGLATALTDAGHKVLETYLRSEDPGETELAGGFALSRDIAFEVRKAVSEGELPIILCGSCTIAAVGAIAGLAEHTPGIAWFDAHPDLHTAQTTTSGLFEGMALATATGHAWAAMTQQTCGLRPAELAHTALYGARDIDEAERALIEAEGVPIAREVGALNDRLAGTSATYAHLDMDVHDGLRLRTNAFAVDKGPKEIDVHDALVALDRLAVLAVTGLDPQAPDAEKGALVAIQHLLAVAETWKPLT